MTGTPSFPYSPGDRVRVLIDEPSFSHLKTGDIVTVKAIGTKVEPDGTELDIVVVSTNLGDQIIDVRHVESAGDAAPDYVPAEADEITDAHLRSIISSDPDLMSLFTYIDSDLSAVTDAAEQLAAEPEPAPADRVPVEVSPNDIYDFTDRDDDSLRVVYAETQCPDHGLEGVFFFETEDGVQVAMNSEDAPRLIIFLHQHIMEARRKRGQNGTFPS